jgi:demethylmenaquinone methyltransferase/2-methoxy-6-polyprenyl-1,4-benzoquinol methylase
MSANAPESNAGDAGVLRDQIDYYRARAGEYDQWWFREGRYDRGQAFNAQWHTETAAVEHALDAWLADRAPRRVLELACGTGLFTRRIAPCVAQLTAVDASAEVMAINRARVAGSNVEYVQADLFAWRPTERYDAVFFSFWLSHVPDARFDAFWATVRSAVREDGAVFLIDSAFDPSSTARDHVLPDRDTGVVMRKLNDGREFRIVKVFWEPAALTSRLGGLDWTASLARTPRYFIYGATVPRGAVS